MPKKADIGKNACATSSQTTDSRCGTAISGCVFRASIAFFSILLENSRKTERGAKRFLTRAVVRAAPFALLTRHFEIG
jgi:hypothetical protein